MGKSTISMAIFNCYVSSPEGTYKKKWWVSPWVSSMLISWISRNFQSSSRGFGCRNSRWKFMAAIDLNMFLNFIGWVSCWEFHRISIIVSSGASLCSLCFRLSSLCFCWFSPFLKFNCHIFWVAPYYWWWRTIFLGCRTTMNRLVNYNLDSSWIVPGFYRFLLRSAWYWKKLLHNPNGKLDPFWAYPNVDEQHACQLQMWGEHLWFLVFVRRQFVCTVPRTSFRSSCVLTSLPICAVYPLVI